MTEKLELYKCSICGNLVQVLLSGTGELVCCNQPMEKLCPKTNEDNELSEKHIPVIEQENDKKFVRLTKHPMIPEHYIQFIEVFTKDKSKVYLKFLNPNEKAELEITGRAPRSTVSSKGQSAKAEPPIKLYINSSS